jgi:hypothetical protein
LVYDSLSPTGDQRKERSLKVNFQHSEKNFCTHGAGTITRVLKNGPHYAELRCKDCDAHISYLPNPATLERRKRNAENLRKLQALKLSPWEQGFIDSLSQQQKWSPRQQDVFEKICASNLKGADTNE